MPRAAKTFLHSDTRTSEQLKEWIYKENLWIVLRKFINDIAQENLSRIKSYKDEYETPIMYHRWNKDQEEDIDLTTGSLIWVMRIMFEENGLLTRDEISSFGDDFYHFRKALDYHMKTTAFLAPMLVDFIQVMVYMAQCKTYKEDSFPLAADDEETSNHQYRRLLIITCMLHIFENSWRKRHRGEVQVLHEHLPFLKEHQLFGLVNDAEAKVEQNCECFNHFTVPVKGSSVWCRMMAPSIQQYFKDKHVSKIDHLDKLEYESYITERLYARLLNYTTSEDPKTLKEMEDQVAFYRGDFSPKQKEHLLHHIRTRCKTHLYWDSDAEGDGLEYFKTMRAAKSGLKYFETRRRAAICQYVKYKNEHPDEQDSIFLSLVQLMDQWEMLAYWEPKTIINQWLKTWKCHCNGVSPDDVNLFQDMLDNALDDALAEENVHIDFSQYQSEWKKFNLDNFLSKTDIQKILARAYVCKSCNKAHMAHSMRPSLKVLSDSEENKETPEKSADAQLAGDGQKDENSEAGDSLPELLEDENLEENTDEAVGAVGGTDPEHLEENQDDEQGEEQSPPDSAYHSARESASSISDPEEGYEYDTNDRDPDHVRQVFDILKEQLDPNLFGKIYTRQGKDLIVKMLLATPIVEEMPEYITLNNTLNDISEITLRSSTKTWSHNKTTVAIMDHRQKMKQPTEHVAYVIEMELDDATKIDDALVDRHYDYKRVIPNFDKMSADDLQKYCEYNRIRYISAEIAWSTQNVETGHHYVSTITRRIYSKPGREKHSAMYGGRTFRTENGIFVHCFPVGPGEAEMVKSMQTADFLRRMQSRVDSFIGNKNGIKCIAGNALTDLD